MALVKEHEASILHLVVANLCHQAVPRCEVVDCDAHKVKSEGHWAEAAVKVEQACKNAL